VSASELNAMVLNQPTNPTKYQGLDNTSIRTIEEVKGAIMIAKMCPRNENVALDKILKACERKTLVEKSLYEYERGDSLVEGPSIRLAEAVLLHWGNAQSGVREIETNEDETIYEAYAWDVENNVRSSRVFSVKHIRQSRQAGTKKLTDQRDIYEVVANHGARRRRACIIEIIPADVMEAAVEKCKSTLTRLAGEVPREDRIKLMLESFSHFGVGKEMIEKKFGCKLEALSETNLVRLRNIYVSFQDRFLKPENVFEFAPETSQSKASDLNSKLS
jgi:hypothetical protein